MISPLGAWRFTRRAQFGLALVIFAIAALMPSRYVTQATSDSTLHFIGNALLYLSASLALFDRVRLRHLLALLALYSLTIEFAQVLTPSRQLDPRDMFANVCGLMTGYGLALLVWEGCRRWLARSAAPNPRQAEL